MAVLSRGERRTDAARKHAKRSWKCPVCGRVVFGNGGRASHQRMHMTAAGYTGVEHKDEWRQYYNEFKEREGR